MSLQNLNINDLTGLPYTLMKWQCIAEGCKNHVQLRNYNSYPILFWNRKHSLWVDTFRCGYVCSKHFKIYKKKIVFKLNNGEFSTNLVFKTIKQIERQIL